MKKNSGNKKNPYIIAAACFMIVVTIVAVILTQHTGVEDMYNTHHAIEKIFNGISTGDSVSAAEGGRQLLDSIWVDLKNVLIMFLVVIAGFIVLYAVYRIYHFRHRNTFEKDNNDDFWNT